MKERKLKIKKLRASAKDFLYVVVFLAVVTGFFSSAYSFASAVKPVEALTSFSTKVIEVPVEKEVIKEIEVPITDKGKPIDVYVGESVDKFFKDGRSSEMRVVLHCLLSRETRHDVNKGRGDGGLAGGPLQYHDSTWLRMRNNMIKDGYASEVGKREDLKLAIDTTAYAIFKGWGKEWGPLLRAWNNAGWAECPLPSWYQEQK